MSDSGVSSSRPRMWAGRGASWSSSAVCYRFLKTFSKCQSCHGESVQVQTHKSEPLGAVADFTGAQPVWDEELSRRSEEERRRSAPGGRAENSISTVLDLCDLAWASQTADYSSSMAGPVRVRLALFYSLLITPTHN